MFISVVLLSIPLVIASDSIDIPKKPYGPCSFLIDYGMLLENYQYVLAASDVSDKMIRNAIKTFVAPIRAYQKSYDDDEVTDEKRKTHLLGMASYLGNGDTMSATQIGLDEWKEAEMWDTVMNRTSFSAALKSRAALYSNITDEDVVDKATTSYQRALKSYAKLLQATDEAAFSKIITKDLDWDLFESRYYNLVMSLQDDKDKKRVGKMRKYLAVFLCDGDSKDSEYEKLMGGSKNALKRSYGAVGRLRRRSKSSTSSSSHHHHQHQHLYQ